MFLKTTIAMLGYAALYLYISLKNQSIDCGLKSVLGSDFEEQGSKRIVRENTDIPEMLHDL